MANIVVVTLSVSIGLFFILIGTIKLSPILSVDVYREMRKNFIRYTNVFPLQSVTHWRPSPHMLRRVLGVSDVVGGLVLAFVPGPLKQLSNFTLLFSCIFTTFCHVCLHDPLEKMTSPIIFALLLICRFIVRLQVNAREQKEAQLHQKDQYDEVKQQKSQYDEVKHKNPHEVKGHDDKCHIHKHKKAEGKKVK